MFELGHYDYLTGETVAMLSCVKRRQTTVVPVTNHHKNINLSGCHLTHYTYMHAHIMPLKYQRFGSMAFVESMAHLTALLVECFDSLALSQQLQGKSS